MLSEPAGGNAGRALMKQGNLHPGQVAALAVRLEVMDEVDLEQLRIGLEVELEHGRRDALTNVTDDDPLLTAKIALANLRELPDYYTQVVSRKENSGDRDQRSRALYRRRQRHTARSTEGIASCADLQCGCGARHS